VKDAVRLSILRFDKPNEALTGEGCQKCDRTCPNRTQNLPLFSSRDEIGGVSDGSSRRHPACHRRDMAGEKRFVYVLKNGNHNAAFYVGLSSDVDARLAAHNAGRCSHTASRRPWQLHVVIEFSDEQRAIRFERYLKSGSGRAFAKRHFEP
jgi:putative endonuclease